MRSDRGPLGDVIPTRMTAPRGDPGPLGDGTPCGGPAPRGDLADIKVPFVKVPFVKVPFFKVPFYMGQQPRSSRRRS